MKSIYIILITLITFTSYTQVVTDTIIESRNGAPPQAVINIVSSQSLFAGQQYSIDFGVSGEYDLEIEYSNCKLELTETGKRSTGGIEYYLTPLDTGYCKIITYISRNGEILSCLRSNIFRVDNYKMPSLYISEVQSGEVLNGLSKTSELSCHYPFSLGVYDIYEIKNWTAKIGDQLFNGKDTKLTKELEKAILNAGDNQILMFDFELKENPTGFTNCKAVFILK